MKILLLMILGHLFADYTLQGWFCNGKQVSWWREQCADECNLEFERRWRKYGNDYKCALLEHGLYWSLITFLPLFFLVEISDVALVLTIIINTLFHAFVDDLKANKFKINLIEDQLLHFSQIFITFGICNIGV